MPPRIGWRILAALLPLTLGAIGLYNNFNDWRSAQTLGQHVAAAGVVVYGPLGVLAAIAILAGWRAWRPLFLGFAGASTLVCTLAPVVWGGANPFIGLIAGLSFAMLSAASIGAGTMAFPSQSRGPTPP